MTGAAVRESVKVAGLRERARVIRAFVGAVLGPGHPCEATLPCSQVGFPATACGIAGRVFPERRSPCRPVPAPSV